VSTVRDILARKGSNVVSLPPSASALEAAQLMNERGIGAVLVVREDGAVAGIFTERDVLRRVVAMQRHPRECPLVTVMTRDLVTCDVHTSLEECAAVMTARRVRHLPVMDGAGALAGLVSIGDLLAHRVAEQQDTITALERYIHDVR
jgi:CBS domain-containing protein